MKKVLIANRGEIAVRIVRACYDSGLQSVAVYSDPDADALHVRMADEAYTLGGSTGAETYLDMAKVIAVARRSGAHAVHPGYGFLSENADFAQAVLDAGLTWIGPTPESIRALGNKVTARDIAVRAGAPLVPGSDGPVANAGEVLAFAQEYGLPVAIKAAFGGGGRGLKVARRLEDVEDAFDSAVRESTAAFGRGECFVERFLDQPRHVEAQVLADTHGNVVVLGTRDCSLQRRNQKLVEEAPAPFLTADQRAQIHASAKAICREADYHGAGTVEYLVGKDGIISFLEVNTRLQVEHPVTEETSGVDLVREQFRIAAGGTLSLTADPEPRGHAIEFRLNAEDPARGFLPGPGIVEAFEPPTGAGIRVDSGVRSGSVVSGHYDSLLAKLIVHGEDRNQALRRARAALDEMQIKGLPTVLPFHRAVVRHPDFTAEDRLGVHTTWIENEFAEPLAASPEIARTTPASARTTITVELDGKAVQLGLPSRIYEALVNGGGGSVTAAVDAQGAAADGQDDRLVSPMSGSLVKWLVDTGDQVEAGQPIAVLEAMKMETTVAAHRPGTVARGAQEPGSAVARGDVLASIA
ncbi:ATP-grasp domain-containing protein [Pseudarthrobacter sp. R1]|uniref:acetyl/propionyl/methylcrotonyl-CoA carboxylase subunit alpha n=1 Tax=Pseudarthrobacter sp. R1 TaxID=2944934 RepID=UPI00210A4C61|nr:biotin carboxylase N-terminal domain-containing protein [Pseudarthrobacter sp. R1]MCQ6270147.1 ATP-grasp domain-containing protein [Pseudarthrobacter sp. R1]